ncbi:hypothetical protein RD792_010509 [Penstemon davidsonii]|uniref:Stress-response A/B barrel domain-containing protein n=1 Tax=Penstemon davidsonii TaxID=160366 RepID=A0ABR0D3Z2_9LAMI|nr:hypothetical protein RD792_010509 [Penstemon davidsonii]
MEEGKGEVKHIVLAKFKDEMSETQIEESIKQYANLVNLVPSMKSFRWGKDLSIENMHQGFTHIFESTFESTEGIAEYLPHPDHVEYGNKLRSQVEKVLVVDYMPSKVQL